MATLAEFSAEEQQLLKESPYWVYNVMKRADGAHPLDRGTVEMFRESRVFKKMTSQYNTDSALVKGIVADDGKPKIDADMHASLAKLTDIANLVDSKAADESAALKSYLYRVAEAVAEASGDKLFGMGEKISEAEIKTLNDIKAALRM